MRTLRIVIASLAAFWSLAICPVQAVPEATKPYSAVELPVATLSTLIAWSTDADSLNRLGAVQELARRKDPSTVPALKIALGDTSATIRMAAAEALLHMGDSAAMPALKKLLTDKNRFAAFRAASALITRGDAEATHMLYAAVTSKEPFDRHMAITGLVQFGPDGLALVAFRAAAKEPEATRVQTLWAMSDRIRPWATRELVPWLDLAQPEAVRSGAATALQHAATMQTVPYLISLVDDPLLEVRKRALWGIRQATGRADLTSGYPSDVATAKVMKATLEQWWATAEH